MFVWLLYLHAGFQNSTEKKWNIIYVHYRALHYKAWSHVQEDVSIKEREEDKSNVYSKIYNIQKIHLLFLQILIHVDKRDI